MHQGGAAHALLVFYMYLATQERSIVPLFSNNREQLKNYGNNRNFKFCDFIRFYSYCSKFTDQISSDSD